MALNGESAFAVYNAEIRRHRAVKLTVGKSKQFRDRLEDLPETDDELENVSSLPQAKNFEALCSDLDPDGATFYLLYRILSKTCHAGPYVIDQYMTSSIDEELDALHRMPLRPGMDPLLMTFVVAASLILAGRAVDYIDPARTRRSELRAAARDLGIPPELKLSAAAFQRIRQAEQSRTRAKRRGKPGGKNAD
jgi:hypothetical protein